MSGPFQHARAPSYSLMPRLIYCAICGTRMDPDPGLYTVTNDEGSAYTPSCLHLHLRPYVARTQEHVVCTLPSGQTCPPRSAFSSYIFHVYINVGITPSASALVFDGTPLLDYVYQSSACTSARYFQEDDSHLIALPTLAFTFIGNLAHPTASPIRPRHKPTRRRGSPATILRVYEDDQTWRRHLRG
ncbi:hypothetical protein CYLTODRAFT_277615 [Cylindrobasidium torrendii FP15055 ss-10]|uniref:Uncharacterized protein n=1 Tax=Cylindrobasidium torrendii FP15055 ss-10 TaxID=1314674 RepID=A0A0D7BBJ6_9AGAR|nr:hypothetical protein CYLTODRAFT_277615 [Cylindrobasidium torrendii FP15055 ss-10]